MRFNLGGFGRKGEFDRLDVSTYYDAAEATVTVTPAEELAWNSYLDATITVTPSVDPLALGVLIETTISLPAVMYYIDIDWHITIDTSITLTGENKIDWTLAAINDDIVSYPLVPDAKILVNTGLVISYSVNQDMIKKMRNATVEFATISVGGKFSPYYFRDISISIPDYTGTYRKVFEGFFPSSKAKIGADGNFESLVAHDYAWYLTRQELNDSQLTYLKPADELLIKKYQLEYYNIVSGKWFHVGEIVVGLTSGDSGKILENYACGSDSIQHSYMIIESLNGDTLTFIDGEDLSSMGEKVAEAYGTAYYIGGDPAFQYTMSPDLYIADLLGGPLMFARTTGIEPYQFTSVDWDDASVPPAIEIDFPEKTKKIEAIERLCKYLKYIFMVKSFPTGTTFRPVAYFVPEANIDDPIGSGTGLDLPAAVYVTKGHIEYDPDNPSTDAGFYVKSPARYEQIGDEKYNRITVRCESASGGIWYSKVVASSGLDPAGDEKPIDYSEINKDICTQADCNTRAADLYAYYVLQVSRWTVTFALRSDFQLLQKLIFSGYPATEIPDGTYRIIGIVYDYSKGTTINEVTCTLMLDSEFKNWLNLNRVFTSSITAMQNMIKDEIGKHSQTEVATVLSIDDDDPSQVTVQTERGIIKKVRNP